MSEYPTWNPENPEESFNNLIRILELKDDDRREGNYRGISGSQLKTNTVSAENLKPQVITSAYLAPNSVNTAHIQDGTILGSDIASQAVSSGNVEDGSIIHVKIGTSAVYGDKIGLEAVSAGHIGASAVYGSRLAESAVSGGHIQTSAISRSNLNIPVHNILGPFLGAMPGTSIAGTNVSCFVGQIKFPRHRVLSYSDDTTVSAGSGGFITYVTPEYIAPKSGRVKTVNVIAKVLDTFSIGTSSDNNSFKAVPLINDVTITDMEVSTSTSSGDRKYGYFGNETTSITFSAGDRLSVMWIRSSRATINSNVPPYSLQSWLNIELD